MTEIWALSTIHNFGNWMFRPSGEGWETCTLLAPIGIAQNNVGSLTSHNPISLYGLLWEIGNIQRLQIKWGLTKEKSQIFTKDAENCQMYPRHYLQKAVSLKPRAYGN
jgi:hypothetical protein